MGKAMTGCLKDRRITRAGGDLRRSLVQASARPPVAVSSCSGLCPSYPTRSACWALSTWHWGSGAGLSRPERRVQVSSLLTQVNASVKTQHHWNVSFPSPSCHTLEL